MLSSYSFNLYYIKGKYMILSDFLSRQKHDESNPHEIIPISFNMQEVLSASYYNIPGNKEQKIYLIQIRSQTNTSGTILPNVHSIDEGVDTNL